MQCRQRTTGNKSRNESTESKREVRARQILLGLVLAIKHPAQVKNHDNKQVGWTSEEVEQHVGDKRTSAADTILDFRDIRRMTKAGISRVVRDQRIPQNQRKRPENVQCTFTQRPVDLHGQSR